MSDRILVEVGDECVGRITGNQKSCPFYKKSCGTLLYYCALGFPLRMEAISIDNVFDAIRPPDECLEARKKAKELDEKLHKSQA
jgi:hypothetical protein